MCVYEVSNASDPIYWVRGNAQKTQWLHEPVQFMSSRLSGPKSPINGHQVEDISANLVTMIAVADILR